MNEYKITYATPETDMDYTLITERTESAATKAFKARYKGTGTTTPDIYDIELICTDACATKQQERDTLAAIKKMVEELGPQSYLATAFDGCFEIAEQNIENDFADSMKDRWIHADMQFNSANGAIEELKEQLAESQRDLEAAHDTARAIAETNNAEIAALRERLLSHDDLTVVIHLVTEKRLALESEAKNAAERIVEAAAEPDSAAFQNAVKDHRAAKSDVDHYTALLERLVKANGE